MRLRPLRSGESLAAVRFTSICLGIVLLVSSLAYPHQGEDQTAPAQADQKKKKTAPTPETPAADAAHRQMLDAQDRSEETMRLTEAATAGLGAPHNLAPIDRSNLIDAILFRQMEERDIPHAALTSDEQFLRRVMLDIVGLPPSSEHIRSFVADADPNKRATLIDSLVGTEEFAEQWAWFWGDLFRLAGQVGFVKNAFQYWMKEWLMVDRPYDDVLHDLLTGVAKAHGTIPAMTFMARSHQAKSRIVMSPDDYSIHNRLDAIDQFNVDVSRVFLGVNTSCVSCHDGAEHLEPVNSWLTKRTRAEFYRHSAFFGKTRMVTTWDDRTKNVVVDLVVDDLGKGYDTANDAPFQTLSENRFPRLDGQTYEPAFLLTGEKPRPGHNERAELARMVSEHPQFARAAVNLIWGKLMTIAFVEPYNGFDLDRLDPANPPEPPWTIQPSNPELLEALAEDFRDSGYSMHHLMKRILTSSSYQLRADYPGNWNDDYRGFYPRKFVRVLTGPELIDSIGKVTDLPPEFTFSGTKVSRVKSLASPGDLGARRGRGEGAPIDALMQSFFQSNRMTPAPVGNKASALQALLMMQSSVITDRVASESQGRVGTLVRSDKAPAAVVEELYLSTLGRWPTSAETDLATRNLVVDRAQGAENLQWALLNSPEFMLNH